MLRPVTGRNSAANESDAATIGSGSATPVSIAVAATLALCVGACNRPAAPAGADAGVAASSSPSSAPVGSASGTPGASASGSAASASSASSAKVVAVGPVGSGVTEVVPLAGNAACKEKSVDVGTYLLRGELDIAARDNAIAAAWLIQLPGKPNAQVAFGGFDGEGRQLARGRGIGSSRDSAPSIFAAGASDWTVAWFDAEGLAHTHPRWESLPAAEVGHLSALAGEVAEHVGLAVAPGGSMVAVAPFGPDKAQLGLFLFAPLDAAAPALKALALTHRANKPRTPAVAADAAGYHVAWLEDGDAIVATHFDAAGKEIDENALVAPPGAKRERLALAMTASGGVAVWEEDGSIRVRPVDASARPAGPIQIVGKGRGAAVVGGGEGGGAYVGWLGADGKTEQQVLVTRLAPDGAPSAKALRVSGGTLAVKDPPVVALAGSRLAAAWAEPMGPVVSSKRAVLRIIDAACVE